MANVKIFKGPRGHEYWGYVAAFIARQGFDVFSEPQKADVSIVLSGRFENPLVFQGRRILAFDAGEWFKNIPYQRGWKQYKVVLDEYYDDFIDLTNLDVEGRAKMIVRHAAKEQRGTDRKHNQV